jgi:hypothetical protein
MGMTYQFPYKESLYIAVPAVFGVLGLAPSVFCANRAGYGRVANQAWRLFHDVVPYEAICLPSRYKFLSYAVHSETTVSVAGILQAARDLTRRNPEEPTSTLFAVVPSRFIIIIDPITIPM